MYDKKNVAFILTSLEAIEKLFLYTEGIRTAEEFLERDDQLIFNACQTLLLTIGEETRKIDAELKSNFTRIPWQEIAKMRNRLAHDYRGTNPNISFNTIKNHLGPLKSALIEMINTIEYPKEKLAAILATKYYKHIRYLL